MTFPTLSQLKDPERVPFSQGFLSEKLCYRIPRKKSATVLKGISGHFPPVLEVNAQTSACQADVLNAVMASPTKGIQAPHSY